MVHIVVAALVGIVYKQSLVNTDLRPFKLINMNYEDKLLLKIKRKYSKDEEISLLIQKIKELEFNNGELKSEIEELKYVKEYIPILSQFKDSFESEGFNPQILTDYKNCQKNIRDLRKTNAKLLSQIGKLVNQT